MFNLIIHQGADFNLPIALMDENGDAVDLTGATVEAQVREFPESKDYHDFQYSIEGNRIELSMPHEDTSKICFSYGAYDVMINYPNGNREKVLWGNVDVIQEVSRPTGD